MNVGAILNQGGTAAFGNKNQQTRISGVLPTYKEMHNLDLTVGRFFSEQENKNRSRVVLLGQTVVKNLFGERI